MILEKRCSSVELNRLRLESDSASILFSLIYIIFTPGVSIPKICFKFRNKLFLVQNCCKVTAYSFLPLCVRFMDNLYKKDDFPRVIYLRRCKGCGDHPALEVLNFLLSNHFQTENVATATFFCPSSPFHRFLSHTILPILYFVCHIHSFFLAPWTPAFKCKWELDCFR